MPRLHSASEPPATGFFARVRNELGNRTEGLHQINNQALDWYRSQLQIRQILIQIGGVVAIVVGVLVLIFHKYLIELLVIISDDWAKLPGGRLILFLLVFFVGFPPLIGYSALSLLAGMVYGFPYGWPLLALASVSGSFVAFLVFRYFLRSQGERLVNSNEKFRAFAEILREDSSLFLLVLIRLCPLPYSLSNGALAAIPELSAWVYLGASVITSPKMLIHLFVGHKIKEFGDAKTDTSTKIIDVISILVTGAAASLTTFIIYRKMQQKLHHNRAGANYDAFVFGNFDDLESGTNVELNSADFDQDNFIITDDELEEEEPNGSQLQQQPKSKSPEGTGAKP